MQPELSQFAAVIGIDWADKKHDICVQDMATGRRRRSRVRHRAEDLDEWAGSMYRRYGGPIAVALELSKGPIVSVLQKYDLAIEWVQDKANLQRRIHRLDSDTKYLIASVARAEAQAKLDRILAQDEITQSLQEELEQLRERADEADAAAQAKIKVTEEQLRDYEAKRASDDEETEKQRLEVQRLRDQLDDQRKQAAHEQERSQLELRERAKELEARLEKVSSVRSAKDPELVKLYQKVVYRMYRKVEASPEGMSFSLPGDVEQLTKLLLRHYPDLGSKEDLDKMMDDLMLDDYFQTVRGNTTVLETHKWDPKDRTKNVDPEMNKLPPKDKD